MKCLKTFPNKKIIQIIFIPQDVKARAKKKIVLYIYYARVTAQCDRDRTQRPYCNST